MSMNLILGYEETFESRLGIELTFRDSINL